MSEYGVMKQPRGPQTEVAVETNLYVLHGCLSGEAESSRGHGLCACPLLPRFQHGCHLLSRCEQDLLRVTGDDRRQRGISQVRCNENRRRVAMVTHKGVGDSITPNGRLAAKKMAGQPTLKQVCVPA